jgi:hypothetical protein
VETEKVELSKKQQKMLLRGKIDLLTKEQKDMLTKEQKDLLSKEKLYLFGFPRYYGTLLLNSKMKETGIGNI